MRVDPGSFDAVYRSADDPWDFTTSSYELDKFDTTVASLGAQRYSRCFEPACSIGVLTARLATRADAVVACDASPTAVARARARLGHADHVDLVTGAVPEWWPQGSFDLIVLSELGYYWDLAGWSKVIRRCRASLRPGGEVIAVHWLGSSPDHILSGAVVHAELSAQLGVADLHLERAGDPDARTMAGFVLDRWDDVRDE